MSDELSRTPQDEPAPEQSADRFLWVQRIAWGVVAVLPVRLLADSGTVPRDTALSFCVYGLLAAMGINRGWGLMVPCALVSAVACRLTIEGATLAQTIPFGLGGMVFGAVVDFRIERILNRR